MIDILRWYEQVCSILNLLRFEKEKDFVTCLRFTRKVNEVIFEVVSKSKRIKYNQSKFNVYRQSSKIHNKHHFEV